MLAVVNPDFTGRTAIVTGAAHGFGRAISLAFAARGAAVWACDVIADELRRDAAALPGRGRQLHVRTCRRPRRATPFAGSLADASKGAGLVHILVNNAGGVLGQVGQPLEEVTSPQSGRRSSTST